MHYNILSTCHVFCFRLAEVLVVKKNCMDADFSDNATFQNMVKSEKKSIQREYKELVTEYVQDGLSENGIIL